MFLERKVKLYLKVLQDYQYYQGYQGYQGYQDNTPLAISFSHVINQGELFPFLRYRLLTSLFQLDADPNFVGSYLLFVEYKYGRLSDESRLFTRLQSIPTPTL